MPGFSDFHFTAAISCAFNYDDLFKTKISYLVYQNYGEWVARFAQNKILVMSNHIGEILFKKVFLCL